ncbi:Chalcone-flavanone isomerase [alpha proteobacterium HIMB59]|nr:Chalcone-flavanone isomerase [alpha proteobacterium HIMB59]
MKKFFALIILVFSISWTSQAQQEEFQSPKLIGEGTLKVLMWEVYDLRLFTDGTPFSWNNKFLLEFDYSRELKKESVIDASLKEFKLQPNVTDKDIKAWEVYLEQVIQSVQKGAKASIMWVPDGQIIFHYEGSKPTTIENEKFARAFLNIWLGEKTSRPKLRNKLLNKS